MFFLVWRRNSKMLKRMEQKDGTAGMTKVKDCIQKGGMKKMI